MVMTFRQKLACLLMHGPLELRDPNHWENPLDFRPERFIDEDGEYCEPFGFGSGRKMGPGISLALPLLHATLAAMAQCFELKLDGILDMEEKPGLVVPRAHSVTCVPLPRIHPFPSI
ncbi:hypothetical protein S83_018882 [Arachis hypogaea]